MKRRIISTTIILASFLGVAGYLFVKPVEDPQIIAQREKMQQKAEETGYGDIEIDNLHRRVAYLLPRLTGLFTENKEKNENVLILPIAYGESVKSISLRYLYDGYMYLYTDSEKKKLEKVVIRFTRMMPLGFEFKEERRDMINPTPLYHEDNKIDSNDDISIIYYEYTLSEEQMAGRENPQVQNNDENRFKEADKIILKELPFFDKKISLVETYKTWLRRATTRLERKVVDLEMKERVRVQHIMDMQ